jgi:hypothetical protein
MDYEISVLKIVPFIFLNAKPNQLTLKTRSISAKVELVDWIEQGETQHRFSRG